MISSEPHITVGIVADANLRFRLLGDFVSDSGEYFHAGEYCAESIPGEESFYIGNTVYSSLILSPCCESSFFELPEVIIGVEFHWQRSESQRFSGKLRMVCVDDKVWAINEVLLETYLSSVISSEMSATSSPQLLKAHTVISRSWLLAQLPRFTEKTLRTSTIKKGLNEDEILRWYDRDDHTLFDVCADDHCQRYQGITRIISPHVLEAVTATRGQVLMYDGAVCDARFSKCCGGVSERYESCWDDTNYPYLTPIIDTPDSHLSFDLSDEQQASHFILSSPEAFCNTADVTILSQVLNNYDRETPDFYRWQVRYTADELSALIYRRSGIDFGRVLSLVPVQRGASGRIVRLRIEGTRRTMIVGKELYIRRILSPTHLYSSAFVVERDNNDFILSGAGWGHGVGLCQIGAAVMAQRGYDYTHILHHYYPAATLQIIYR